MKTLSIDIETYSDQPLAKTGVYRYVESPVFEILLFSYSVDGDPVQLVDLACGEQIPADVIAALEDDSVTKWAFNANFERICLSRYLGYPTGDYLKADSWKCSMVWAATMGLPLSLEGVGSVLGLEKQKLTEGKDLIKYFCQPCAPTKSNGQRTRNLPAHAPDKWLAFKKYNIRDVETEMSIQARLAKYPVPDSVWDEYHIDQEINDRGVALDMELVQQAIQMDGRSRSKLTQAMKDLTALENPNSVQQMKQWLSDNGMETDTLGKKAVAEMLKTAPPELQKVLTLRQQLAKSSVKKYQAMETAVCADGRARGMFQFYGANRTGRWAGRIIQMQNLPQNHLEDLAEARGLVRCGDFEGVEMLYEDVPDKLKDSTGQYLWQPSLQAGEPDRVLGYKVYTSAYFPIPAPGKAAVAFGDFSYYNIGDRGSRSIAELKELFAGNGMVGFVAKERVDGKLVLPEAVKLLKMASA